jgi:hypothetical protein
VIMMTLVTTVLAPLFLVPATQKPGSGLRSEENNLSEPEADEV